MFFTKLILLFGILYMFTRSNPPYFPIEISRCIASNKESTIIFLTTVLTAATTSVFGDRITWNSSILLIFSGLIVLGAADDVSYWLLHMIGVGMVMIGILWNISRYNFGNYRHILFGIAIVLYFTRLIIKAYALYQWETNDFKKEVFKFPINILGYPEIMKKKAFDIMYTGKTNHPNTLKAFAYGGGVLQWIVFLLLSFCF